MFGRIEHDFADVGSVTSDKYLFPVVSFISGKYLVVFVAGSDEIVSAGRGGESKGGEGDDDVGGGPLVHHTSLSMPPINGLGRANNLLLATNAARFA